MGEDTSRIASLSGQVSHPGALSDAEALCIIRGFVIARGDRGASEEDIQAVLARVRQMRLDGLLATLLCAGQLQLSDWRDDDLVLVAPEAGSPFALWLQRQRQNDA